MTEANNEKIDMGLVEKIKKIKEEQNLTLATETNQALVSEEDGAKFVKLIATEKQMSFSDAFTAMAIICQKGGTSKRAQGNIYAVVNSKRLTLADIREIGTRNKLRFTVRQWARTYATEIHGICDIFSIPGDLAKIIGRSHPNISEEDSIWMSNFQMDNPNAPDEIRALILEHFKKLFPNSNK